MIPRNLKPFSLKISIYDIQLVLKSPPEGKSLKIDKVYQNRLNAIENNEI